MLKKNSSYFIKQILFVVISLFSLTATGNAIFSPKLDSIILENQTNEIDSLIDVVIFLENSSSRKSFLSSKNLSMMTRSEKIKTVIKTLKSNKSATSSKTLELLNSIRKSELKSYWITSAYSTQIHIRDLQSLASIDGVTKIVENARLDYIEPVTSKESSTLATSVSTPLKLLNVPEVWARGITGKGSLVCSFDTGVEGTHPALSSKWRGNSSSVASAWFSKDSPGAPTDKAGHGTHTMGVMVGSIPADTFGVAPGAEWISAAVVDQGRTLTLTLAEIIEAFQWTLNPDGNYNTTHDVPDVILNSWGIPQGLFEPCDDMFNGVIEACEAVGIVTIFAAGNEGPEPMSMRHPGDLALTPLNSFAVGAVDNNKIVASFSSRGPSSCDNSIKPEVVAPGMTIRSSYKGGGYYLMSGSSMAAPYIAGIVALLREYNPEVSVQEIKKALINSCEDLGVEGEDNDYGHGLVNALKALDFLTVPEISDLKIFSSIFLNGGIGTIGTLSELEIALINSSANYETLVGKISTEGQTGVTIINDEAQYLFGSGGTTAISNVPYKIILSDSLYNGQKLNLTINFYNDIGQYISTLPLVLTAGYHPPGKIETHETSKLSMTVSDFGQYGLAANSIYNVNGAGFSFENSGNLLYESGLIIGRGVSQISNSIRNEKAEFTPSDFTPIANITTGQLGGDGGLHRTASFTDIRSSRSIPITVSQETITFDNGYDESIIFIKYFLKSSLVETLQNIRFSFFADFDLPGKKEQLAFKEDLNLIYQFNDSGFVVGLIGLKNMNNFTALSNYYDSSLSQGKAGFSIEEKLELINRIGIDVDTSAIGDMMFLAGSDPITIGTYDSTEVSFALLAAKSKEELFNLAATAKLKFGLLTDVKDDFNLIPSDFVLKQNYPNPFNPSTTISFSLTKADFVELKIYNMLGQEVNTVHSGFLSAGNHSYGWDGVNNHGEVVSSGMYFYRLNNSEMSKSKKMMLLK